jgi:hypothetical protein
LRRSSSAIKAEAQESTGEEEMASNNDMKAHEGTYAGVMSMLKWGTIASALLAALVIILISN